MNGEPTKGQKIQFGSFEVDLTTGELTKYGLRIRLAEQPFQVLAALLATPGELVTRERLREELWPADTFVEFDRGLNSAVRRLRHALRDSSSSPRYVETVPKRGYRFIADVRTGQDGQDVAEMKPQHDPEPASPQRLSRRLIFVAALVSAAVAVFLYGIPPFMQASGYRFQARLLENVPADARYVDFSADGRSVAYSWRDESRNIDVYIQQLDQKTPVRITDDPAADVYPRWSPDGALLSFTRNFPAANPGLYVASLADNRLIRVSRPASGAASWMPDGKTLIASGGDARLVSVSLESLEETPLFDEATNEFQRSASVSPNGGVIAYANCGDVTSCDVYIRPVTGGKRTRLTYDDGEIEGIAWTPDGRYLVYALDGVFYRIAASDRARPTRLEMRVPGEPLGELADPAFGRRSRWGSSMLAFRHTRRDLDIWVSDLTTTDASGFAPQRKLIDSPGVDSTPVYSPDGSLIAFLSDRHGVETALWIADADGRNQRRLTPTGVIVREGAPSWSPDGAQIAFRGSTSQDAIDHIYTVTTAGGAPNAVTERDGEFSPLWSRDGKWIYHRTRSPNGIGPEVHRSPADGSGPSNPVTGSPVWSVAESPDGQFVYYCSSSNGQSANGTIYRVPASGGDREVVSAECRLNTHVEFHDGRLYYARQGERGRMAIEHIALETGDRTPVAVLRRPDGPVSHFSMSPDRTSALTTRYESLESALMIVDDFR